MVLIFPSYSYFPRSKFKNVVLPFPFLPTKPNLQLVSIEKEVFSNTLSKLPSYAKVRLFTLICAKVATVTSKGVVKAKKAGTVTITATAKDGSGKKAACRITVKKAAVTPVVPEVPVVIQNVSIVNKAVLQVTLNKAKVLQTSDFGSCSVFSPACKL